MAEQQDSFDPDRESLVHEISEKIHGVDGSTSSFSGADSGEKPTAQPPYVKPKIDRFYDRENRPVHQTDDWAADVFLWKNKNVSAAVLGVVTVVWILFEFLEYHLVTLICHVSILALAMLFLWSNSSIIINKRPPHFPEVRLPQEPFVDVATVLCNAINAAITALREIASVRDLNKFLKVTAVLWVISVVGSLCSFVTLFYILFVFLYTVPVLYEKYEDKVDALAEQTMSVIKKQYGKFNSKVVSKISLGLMNGKKRA